MEFSAVQIAQLCQGNIEGDAGVKVGGFGKIEEATAGQLAFLANPKYEEYLYTTQASVIIVNQSLQLKQPVQATLIRVPDAYSAFASLLKQYESIVRQQEPKGIEPQSFVHETAKVDADAYIAAFAYISAGAIVGAGSRIYPGVFIGKDVHIGSHCRIHANASVYHECKLENRVVIHSGAVIGADGFGFAPQPDGSFAKVPQLGHVVLEDDVEVGSNATIDRATIGATIIRKGAKIDNLVQIAHNVEVGTHSVIAAQAGISGSTRLGAGVMIGGQAGIVGHITIADKARINAQSGVSKSITQPGAAVTGSPAHEFREALRSQALSRKLPELEKRIAALEALLQHPLA